MRKWRRIIFSMIQIPTRCSDGLRSLPRISKLEQFHQSKVGFQLSKNVKLSGLGSFWIQNFDPFNSDFSLVEMSHAKNEPFKVKHSKQPSLVTIKNSHPRPKKFIQRNSKRKIFQNHLKNHQGCFNYHPQYLKSFFSTPHLSLEFRALYNDHARLNHR